MDTGELGVVSLTITSAMDARRFLALETAGQVRKFPGWQEWSTPRFEITSSGPVQIGVDGEALTMESPVVFEIIPAALTVLLPPQCSGAFPGGPQAVARTPPGSCGTWPSAAAEPTAPAPCQALRGPAAAVRLRQGEHLREIRAPPAVGGVVLGHRQGRGGDLQQRPGAHDAAGAVARGRARHDLDDRAGLRPGADVQDLDRRDVGVPGQHDVDLGVHQGLLELVATGQGLQVVRARRVVHRHHPDGPRRVRRRRWRGCPRTAAAEMRPDFHRQRGMEPSPWMRTVPRSRTGSRFSVTSARYLP